MQSLYPYVCKRCAYPVGNPRVIQGLDLSRYGTDINCFEGLIKCDILPPRGLYIPLLPTHIDGKLLFTLCRTCAEEKNIEVCTHDKIHRALHGVWVTTELKKAVSIGYEVCFFLVFFIERISLFLIYIILIHLCESRLSTCMKYGIMRKLFCTTRKLVNRDCLGVISTPS